MSEPEEYILQEIFIDIWKNAARFDAEKSPESVFVMLIAHRRVIDFLRKNYRPPILPYEDALRAQAIDTHQKLHISLDVQVIIGYLNKLRIQESSLIRLTIYGGLSHKEIAERAGIPIGTVKSHIRRGLKNKILNRTARTA